MIRKDASGPEALMIIAGSIVVMGLIVLWAGFWCGLTLSYLWGWFIAPVFGLPTLSIPAAYGVALTAFAAQHRPADKKENIWGRLAAAPLYSGIMLVVGYILFHGFIN